MPFNNWPLTSIGVPGFTYGRNPKKVVGNNCFLGGSPLIPSGRVRVFAKNSVCISDLIGDGVEIDVSLFSSSNRSH